jgi:hypothetical protein
MESAGVAGPLVPDAGESVAWGPTPDTTAEKARALTARDLQR